MDNPTRVALVGGFGSGNFGNDASLAAALALLRERFPNASFESVCHDPDVVRERFGVPAIKLARRPSGALALADNVLLRIPSGTFNWTRALRAIDRFDVVVFPGTGVLDDYRTGPLGFPAQVFRWCVAARLRGVRVIFWSVGAGPIINPLSRFFLKTAALCASHRTYRDAASKDFMESIGVDETQSAVLPDIVFAAPAPMASPVRSQPPLTIGLGVMSYRGWRIDERVGADYLSKLARFVRYAEAAGHHVKLLGAEASDMRSIHRLKQMLGDDVDRGGDGLVTLDDVMEHIARCDIVIGSRYHVLIAGLKMGRPCISLSYGPKNDQLLTEYGLGNFCQHADFFDFDLLVSHFETIAADLPNYSALVSNGVANASRRLVSLNEAFYGHLAAHASQN